MLPRIPRKLRIVFDREAARCFSLAVHALDPPRQVVENVLALQIYNFAATASACF
jgi:hypothetical protein